MKACRYGDSVQLFPTLVILLLLAAIPTLTQGAAADDPTALTAARLYKPDTLSKRFNTMIETINGIVGKIMFFDVSLGRFLITKTDDNGQAIHEKIPVLVTINKQIPGYLLNKNGTFVLREDHSRVVVTLEPGEKAHRVDSHNKLAFTKGNPVRKGPRLPLTVIFLAGGAVFFTFWYGWINLRGFKHAIDIVLGKFTRADDPGEISPFRALTSALSATVGLGNIAGVAIAVKLGGPGAIFWMMFLGLFGMTAKFHESTLAQMFRRKNSDGSISGGPMFYLDAGLKSIHPVLGILGKYLAIIFAVFCIGGALGGGNMFQANQSYEGFFDAFVAEPSLAEKTRQSMHVDRLRSLLTMQQLNTLRTSEQARNNTSLEQVRRKLSEEKIRKIVQIAQIKTILPDNEVQADRQHRDKLKRRVSYGYGILMAAMVGIVVVGGITRIGAATSKIVPAMCLIYVAGCLLVIIMNIRQIPGHVGLIFQEAFKWESTYGGVIGVMVMGFTRAAFSSEAGLGSSAIAHSAAKQAYPVREGLVASLEPFIDTIVICFMTAMVVLITGAYKAPELLNESNGTAVTLHAFRQTPLGAWFPYVLSISVVLFAFSTMISWCYYGEQAYSYLLGPWGKKTILLFRMVFVICVFVGSVASLGPVLDFSDLMILSMAFPNILGGLFLLGMVRRSLKDYWARHKNSGLGGAGGPTDDADL